MMMINKLYAAKNVIDNSSHKKNWIKIILEQLIDCLVKLQTKTVNKVEIQLYRL